MCDIHPPLQGYSGTDCIFCAAERHRHCQKPPATQKPLATQFRCCDCARDFKSEQALADHLRYAKTHKIKRPEESEVTTCAKCKKKFKNASALKAHAESPRHKPLSNIQCLAHKECKKRFNCPSGQLQHLESGRCKSKMTKKILNEAIAKNDPGGIITSGGLETQWSLEGPSSASSTPRSQSPIFTPTSSHFSGSYPPSGASTPRVTLPNAMDLSTALTLRLRPGARFQTCPLCPPVKTRTYTPDGLRGHLSSGIHKSSNGLISSYLSAPEITFHCPRGLVDAGEMKKMKEFATVSGLAQHLESGACSGGKQTMKRVLQYVQEEMKNLGFGERKLFL